MNNAAFPRREGDPLRVAIKQEQITIAPDSRDTIQVGIFNDGPNEDYVEVMVRGVPDEWVTIDTPVVNLIAGEAKLVNVTLKPPAVPESRVGQYPLDVHVVSQNDPTRAAVARSILTVAAYQSRGRIGIMLDSIQFTVNAGSTLEIPILLQNRGDEEDSFRLEVEGIPPTWVSANSMLTRLEPKSSTEVLLSIFVPRSPDATAGPNPFTIQFASQVFPTQTTEVECVLTIPPFSQFTTSLEPGLLQSGQFGQVIVNNEGNTSETYSLAFQSRDNELVFERAIQVPAPQPQTSPQQMALTYVEIVQGEQFQVPAGGRGAYSFRSRLRTRPLLGGEQTYPFGVQVRSTTNDLIELSGQVSERGLLPFWVLPAAVVGALVFCLLFIIPLSGLPTSTSATQTASVIQTQTALSGTGDSDGDGLTNEREASLGTNPLLADTDADRLSDRDEVDVHLTNPLNADTDGDGLSDGDEVLTHLSDPRNPDMDGDGVTDGAEIARNMDPRNSDTDGDGLRDGDEIRLETDPRNPDTDGDGLLDGQENETCPHPRNPDTDNDGIVDGRDLDPCNPANPALTATAAAVAAQATAAAPPSVTVAPVATQIILPTITLTSPPAATATQSLPSLQGTMLLSSNRAGNSEIYALNLASQSLTRLTNSPAQEIQPALAPDSTQLVYVGNQDGNNEIYLTALDGRAPLNLTNHPGDDQQPVWSPDGNWIAFTSNRDGNREIYVMRRDGTQVRNLTNSPADDFAATWFSAGGFLSTQDWIAFTTTRDGNQEVYKVKPDGSSLTNLTNNPANDHSPAGFGGGAILAFVSERDGNSEIYVMSDTGNAQTNITQNPAQDLDPSVNPGGVWVAFATDRDGNLDVYIVRIDGGQAFNLTRDPNQDNQPDW